MFWALFLVVLLVDVKLKSVYQMCASILKRYLPTNYPVN